MLSAEQLRELLIRLEMATKSTRACPGPNRRGLIPWVKAYENDVAVLLEEIQSLQAENTNLKSLVPPTTTAPLPVIVPVVVQKSQLPDNDL